jgi:hypothetical protein
VNRGFADVTPSEPANTGRRIVLASVGATARKSALSAPVLRPKIAATIWPLRAPPDGRRAATSARVGCLAP